MKISLALLILLLAAAWTGSQGFSRSSGGRCCSKGEFHHKAILKSKIQDYRYTPSTCTLQAVHVKVKNGWLCVDPQKKWFQEYLRKKNKSNSNST